MKEHSLEEQKAHERSRRRYPTCAGCWNGFTATEAEFAVERDGRYYHATCIGPRRKTRGPQ